MSDSASDSFLTFCTLKDNGRYEIQWQFPRFTVTCTSIDLGFAQSALDFVTETRDNRKYRDAHIGDGIHRYMDEKSIDLSKHFQNVQIRFEKIGESDHSYFLRFASPDGFSLVAELRTPAMIDSFVDGIREIIEDHVH